MKTKNLLFCFFAIFFVQTKAQTGTLTVPSIINAPDQIINSNVSISFTATLSFNSDSYNIYPDQFSSGLDPASINTITVSPTSISSDPNHVVNTDHVITITFKAQSTPASSLYIGLRFKDAVSNYYQEVTVKFNVIGTPSVPTSLTASSITSTGFILSWAPSQRASGYYVYLNGNKYTTTTSSYTFTGLSSGTTYSTSISAYNNYGESPKSNKSVQTVPSAPTNFASTIHYSTWITLSWTASYGATGYRIAWPNSVMSLSGTSADIYGSNANNQQYTLWAINNSGQSEPIYLNVSPLKSSLLDRLDKHHEKTSQSSLPNDEVPFYPNPATDKILIKGFSNFNISIYDINGKLVFNKIGSSEGWVDISNLEKGIYIIKINDSVKAYTQKLVKQ
jgi:hypothetical protein